MTPCSGIEYSISLQTPRPLRFKLYEQFNYQRQWLSSHRVSHRQLGRNDSFLVRRFGLCAQVGVGRKPQSRGDARFGRRHYFEIFEREPSQNENHEERESSALHFCLRTDDCEDALQKAIAAGAEVTLPTTEVDFAGNINPSAKIAFVKAPGGIIVEFFQCDAL